MRESAVGVIAFSVHCRRRALGWIVYPNYRGAGCEMSRHRRSIGGRKCSRGVQSGADDGSMDDGSTHRGDGHFRRGASCRRRTEVDDLTNHTLGVVAVAVAEDAMNRNRTLGVVAGWPGGRAREGPQETARESSRARGENCHDCRARGLGSYLVPSDSGTSEPSSPPRRVENESNAATPRKKVHGTAVGDSEEPRVAARVAVVARVAARVALAARAAATVALAARAAATVALAARVAARVALDLVVQR